MADKNRDELIDDLNPEELKVEKAKVKKEGDKKNLEAVEEEQWEDTQEAAVQSDEKRGFDEERKKAMITEERAEGLVEGEEPDNPYDKEELQPMVEGDAIESQEAGFMRGYDRDSEKPKKKEPKSDEERLEE